MDFISLIKKYEVENLIQTFSYQSILMFKEMKSFKRLVFKVKQFEFVNNIEIGLSVWDIIGIQYAAVCHSTDYRSQTVDNDTKFLGLVNQYRRYENKIIDPSILENASFETINKYLFGLSNEQFQFFNMNWIFNSFNRNYHILKKIQDISDYDAIFNELFNLTIDEYCNILTMLFWLCMQSPDPLSAPVELYNKSNNTILTKENLEKVINYYSVTYKGIRESQIKQQILYVKPFIRTQKNNRLLLSNMYLFSIINCKCKLNTPRQNRSHQLTLDTDGAAGAVCAKVVAAVRLRIRNQERLQIVPLACGIRASSGVAHLTHQQRTGCPRLYTAQ